MGIKEPTVPPAVSLIRRTLRSPADLVHSELCLWWLNQAGHRLEGSQYETCHWKLAQGLVSCQRLSATWEQVEKEETPVVSQDYSFYMKSWKVHFTAYDHMATQPAPFRISRCFMCLASIISLRHIHLRP